MKGIRLFTKKTMIIMITVLMLVISTVSYTLSTLVEAKQQVTQDITAYSRGTYDILIRPAQARTNLEKQLGLIEENYLGIGSGGITIDEWKEIKNHPKVDIAAPVASIGLFTARLRSWMLERTEPFKYYEVHYETSDGLNTYTYNEDTFVYDFIDDFDDEDLDLLLYPSSYEVGNNYLDDVAALFAFPPSYHQVVAVDPEEEGRLVNDDLSLLEEKVYNHRAYKNGKLAIPVLSLKDVSVPNTIKLTIDDLHQPTEEELREWRSKHKDGLAIRTLVEMPADYERFLDKYIHKKRMHNNEVYVFHAHDGPSPFEDNPFFVNKEKKLVADDGTGKGEGYLSGFYRDFSQRIGYQLDPVVYNVIDKKHLSVKQMGIDDNYGAPIYRKMTEVEFFEVDDANIPLNEDEAFEFSHVGFFSIKENQDVLASSPLGIYGRDMPYLATDSSVKLHPSAVPGSFITTPAHGLISLDWAEKIKGEAPIDAIRVKVAGITGYDKRAATLIRDLAAEWEEAGFTVDIVAGASLQDLTVDVEGMGKVVQMFTTLGAADTVISSWNALQVLLTLLYGLVALTFVGYSFSNLLVDRQRDEQLLAQLGWSEKLIRRVRYKEWITMLGIPITLVMIGFTVYGMYINDWLPLILSAVMSIIFLLLLVLASFVQKKKIRRPKKQGKTVVMQNIYFYKSSIIAACIQLFLMTLLTCFLPFFLIQTVANTTLTRLGAYVHGEVEGLFYLVIVLLYVLSLTTVYQSLSRMWETRQSEIKLFLYLGWEKKAIRNYFIKEVLIWAGLSIGFGWMVSFIIMFIFIEMTLITFISGIIGFLLILAVTLGGAIYTLHRTEVKGGATIGHQASSC